MKCVDVETTPCSVESFSETKDATSFKTRHKGQKIAEPDIK